MKKVNLKGISEILSQKEMKNVMGGSWQQPPQPPGPTPGPLPSGAPCCSDFACQSLRCVITQTSTPCPWGGVDNVVFQLRCA